MLVEEWRPKLYCKGFQCDNLSPNGKVFFMEEGHRYFHEEDIRDDGKLVFFENSKLCFRSPTGILKKFKEEFDTEYQAKKYVVKHGLELTWEEQAALWKAKGDAASNEGTILHAYGESLWNNWEMPRPDLQKTPLLVKMYRELAEKYELVKTELLVYSEKVRLAGQVDLLVKEKETGDWAMLDYKFIKAPLEKKSYYNRFTRKYKLMYGPFRHLHDSNYWHYSIQLAIYQWLMGKAGKRITKKALLVVTPEEYMIEAVAPIKIYSKDGIFHAAYRLYNGEVYKSHEDPIYMNNPYEL